MKRAKDRPESAIVVTSYQQLDRFVRAFADGKLNLLIIVGSPGLQKSSAVRQAVGEGAFWIEGNATPFQMYCDLYEHRYEPVVIDDVDSLYADRNGVRLLKCLCQTERVKTAAWHSNATLKANVPTQYKTASTVAIIANSWATLNANVAAVEDRGVALSFEPTALEVNHRTAEWFYAEDQDVFDFIGSHLDLIDRPSMRHYVLGAQLKAADPKWRTLLPYRWLTGTALLVAELQADPGYASEEARVQAFIERGGGCRATYFNHSRRLKPPSEPPRIGLKCRRPGATQPPPQDIIDLLRRRHGRLGNG